ncbi:hypothetical protein CGLO_11916 [Colletotrichum gloeosporioides Cg-14]|uniref:Uncharacterized protein n=1 Tax=Colletotrichum gloeosporioides (strain Cg-14) TaxID=1237896 RepID=T0LKR4_COLGC|nr:hypothetical protein CGLO_11916 [Colletotrichum gloeosporioides Cg-14]
MFIGSTSFEPVDAQFRSDIANIRLLSLLSS